MVPDSIIQVRRDNVPSIRENAVIVYGSAKYYLKAVFPTLFFNSRIGSIPESECYESIFGFLSSAVNQRRGKCRPSWYDVTQLFVLVLVRDCI